MQIFDRCFDLIEATQTALTDIINTTDEGYQQFVKNFKEASPSELAATIQNNLKRRDKILIERIMMLKDANETYKESHQGVDCPEIISALNELWKEFKSKA